ncbi:MAG: hypothetical protein ABIK73_07915 [candidate division WOR-3 bacterium]
MRCIVEEKCEEVGIKLPGRYVGLFILLTIAVTVIIFKIYVSAVGDDLEYFSSYGISSRLVWFMIITVVTPFTLTAIIILLKNAVCMLAIDSIPEEEIKSMLKSGENKNSGGNSD